MSASAFIVTRVGLWVNRRMGRLCAFAAEMNSAANNGMWPFVRDHAEASATTLQGNRDGFAVQLFAQRRKSRAQSKDLL